MKSTGAPTKGASPLVARLTILKQLGLKASED